MKKPIVEIDFETRSVCDLKKKGAYEYARHPTTEIQCLAYSIDGQPPSLWIKGEPPPIELFLEIEAGSSFVAHNAQFEDLIWNSVGVKKYGWPPLPTEQLYCTMTMCYALGLPGSLDIASKALGINHKKDTKGHRIMIQLSKPRSGPDSKCKTCFGEGFWHDPRLPGEGWALCDCTRFWEKSDPGSKYMLSGQKKFDWLYRYCKQDVVVEQEIFARVMALPEIERETWLLDQKINRRGINIDVKAIDAALDLIELEKERLNERAKKLSDGAVSTLQSPAQIKAWLLVKHGIDAPGLAKADILDLLEKDDLPDEAREMLELRREGSKSSNAKIQKMKDMVSSGGRLRGQNQYHGAPSTGRWAGRGVQLQNLPRPKIKHSQIEDVIETLWKVS